MASGVPVAHIRAAARRGAKATRPRARAKRGWRRGAKAARPRARAERGWRRGANAARPRAAAIGHTGGPLYARPLRTIFLKRDPVVGSSWERALGVP
jgi:hypothetical protein